MLDSHTLIAVIWCFCLFHTVFSQSSPSSTTPLNNNQVLSSSIAPGTFKYYYFSVSATSRVFGKRELPTIYLSTTTCSQPQPPSSFHDTVPPLNLFVSTSSSNTLPGPDNGITVEDSLNGLTKWISDNQTAEVWISVGAPTLSTGSWTGNWTFEIGASTNQIMHPVFMNDQKLDNGVPYLMLDDTDRNNALFLSSPFPQGTTPPNSSLIVAASLPIELSHSMCAAKLKQITNYSVNATVTGRGPNNVPRQQFMASNLTQNTHYTAYMAYPYKNSIIGMTTPIFLSTKVDANCRIIYDLEFCNQVAYSVPANPDTFVTGDMHSLALQYDNQALEKFEPLNTSLSQYNCGSTQYSLVRNCTDCYRDYKTWLCAVTIPRCTEASSSTDLNQGTEGAQTAPAVRDISANASRNPWIDETLKTGEWSELLPCIDLCYHVVQSCPPFLQFNCPTGDLAVKQYGYWQNGTTLFNGTLFNFDVNNPTCNRMGVDVKLLTISSASRYYHLNLLFIAGMILSLSIHVL